jgi:transcriptional enhancer factor
MLTQCTVLVYMGKPDSQRKHHRERGSYYSHLDGRHHLHRPASAFKYDHNVASTHLWAGHGSTRSSFALGAGLGDDASRSPYAVESFSMFVEADDQHVHYFTQLSSNDRHRDLVVTDTTSWQLRYPEFNFLRLQTEDWVKQDQKVLVCEASLKIMTEPRPKANLSITFNVHTQRDLSVFKSIECTTRFYDSGNIAPDPLFDGVNANAHDLKEHRTRCEYTPDPYESNGRLRIAFGSKFWVNRMLKYQILRHKDEACVRNSLLRLTATQDVYGIKTDTGEAECVLKILWRFTQTTRSSAEVGSTHWRAVTFGNIDTPVPEQKWVTNEHHLGVNIEDDNEGHGDIMECSGPAPHDPSLYQQALHMPLDFQNLQTSHHIYTEKTAHTHHNPQLQHDIVGSMNPDLEQPHTSALTSASTDYSQQSFLDRPHTQDTMGTYIQENNDFDFNGGHITISGAFESAVGLSAYESFANQSALAGLHTLTALDPDGYSLGLACADGNELIDCENDLQDPANMTCYSIKPNWHHANLISSLENAAEQYKSYMTHDRHQTTHGGEVLQGYAGPSPALSQEEELVAHGLHDAHVNVHAGSWNLQSPFQEDTGSGAHGGGEVIDCRKDSVGQGMGKDSHPIGLGLGVLDLIERDQRSWGY